MPDGPRTGPRQSLLFVPVISLRVFVEGAIQMSRRSILVPETLKGRLLLALSVLAAVMVIPAD